jgi:hypothetical protein
MFMFRVKVMPRIGHGLMLGLGFHLGLELQLGVPIGLELR